MNLSASLFSIAKSKPESIACLSKNQPRSYQELELNVRKIARKLIKLGVRKGDRFAVLSREHFETLVLVYASSMIGSICIPLNYRLSNTQLGMQAADASMQIVFLDEEFLNEVSNVQARTVLLKQLMASIRDCHALENTEMTLNNVLLQIYSSGTTGVSKGVMLTHDNLLANQQVFQDYCKFTNKSCVINALPTFHIAGMSLALNASLAGGKSVFFSHFVPSQILQAIEKEKASHLFVVPTMMHLLVKEAKASSYDLSSLQYVVYGGGPIENELLVEAMHIFNCNFVQTYGMTETTGGVVFLMPEDHRVLNQNGELFKAAGKALFGAEIKIINGETNIACIEEEIGEVLIDSPKNMLGYWNMPMNLSPVFVEEALENRRWLKTGDRGYLKDGYLFLRGRVKEIINTGGEKVSPEEVESVLKSHSSVEDVAVVGVLDEKWGEMVVACVVCEPQSSSEVELIQYAKHHLGQIKSPKKIVFVDKIPRTPSGKTQRVLLGDEIAKTIATAK